MGKTIVLGLGLCVMACACTGLAADAVGGVFNLGTGRDIAIGDLARLVAQLMGREVQVVSEERRRRRQNQQRVDDQQANPRDADRHNNGQHDREHGLDQPDRQPAACRQRTVEADEKHGIEE